MQRAEGRVQGEDGCTETPGLRGEAWTLWPLVRADVHSQEEAARKIAGTVFQITQCWGWVCPQQSEGLSLYIPGALGAWASPHQEGNIALDQSPLDALLQQRLKARPKRTQLVPEESSITLFYYKNI